MAEFKIQTETIRSLSFALHQKLFLFPIDRSITDDGWSDGNQAAIHQNQRTSITSLGILCGVFCRPRISLTISDNRASITEDLLPPWQLESENYSAIVA